jgi:DNA-binding XRE family transcriptional regulator
MSGIVLHMSSPKRQKSLSPDELRGFRLMNARKALGLTQQQVADKLGVSRQTVVGWEKGAEIDEGRMDDVSRAYRATRGWIRYNEGEGPRALVGRSGLPLESD